MSSKEDDRPLVSVRCITYNHGPYIRDCLEGFVSQKTDFKYEVVVHDDASTDGTADIVREYAERYPDIIKPILQTENQYSKGSGFIGRAIDPVIRGKYVAFCEGDDYWIDPLKLQRQVSFLEAYPDYTMAWSDAEVHTPGNAPKRYCRYAEDCSAPAEDIIMRGGGWIPTASMVMPTDFFRAIPHDINFMASDYPEQIWAACKGKNYYFSNPMCVYRFQTQGSWTSRQGRGSTAYQRRWLANEAYIMRKMDEWVGGDHRELFQSMASLFDFRVALIDGDYAAAREIWPRIGEDVRRVCCRRDEWFYGNGYPTLGAFIKNLKFSYRLRKLLGIGKGRACTE